MSSFLEVPTELLVLALRLLFIAALYGCALVVIREIHKDWQKQGPAQSPAAGYGLVVVSSAADGISVGQRFPLARLSTIGRIQGATVRLTDEHISANHAEI